jgi:hypothetical protein
MARSEQIRRKLMKAIPYTGHGPPDILQLREVEKPTPKEDEALVRVYAASLNAADMTKKIWLFWKSFLKPAKWYL